MTWSEYHCRGRFGISSSSRAQPQTGSSFFRSTLAPLISVLIISNTFGQAEYSADGIPSNTEEEIRWLINRGRFNPAAENSARGTNYSGLSPKPPLAPNASLFLASRHHSQDMAEKNVFQHDTVTGSRFYNWQSHRTNPAPDFSERITAEGYPLAGGAENINAGYTSSLASYLGWWNSAGHRSNMYDVSASRSEIGLGYYYQSGSTYRHYYTMLAARNSQTEGFFTGTMFGDGNTDGSYNSGEGKAGIRIELETSGQAHGTFDISSQAGGFAIPLSGISSGSSVAIFLVNTNATPVTLSVPTDYSNLVSLSISPNQRIRLGTFTRDGIANVGFRNLTTIAPAPMPTVPRVSISVTSDSAVLSWPSEPGIRYQVQSSAQLANPWVPLLPQPLTGNGGVLTFTDPTRPSSVGQRFYRVVVVSD